MCRVLRVNRSTYYAYLKRKPSKRECDNQIYRRYILDIYRKAKKRLGTRKIKIILERDYHISISEGRIYRLMKTMALPKMATYKPKKRRNNQKYIGKNILKQQFNPKEPNQVWTTDFTYIPIGHKKFVYLCVILDLFSRKVIAWQVGNKIDTQLAKKTLMQTIRTRKPKHSLILHSDQGSQFKAKDFRKVLDNHHILASYSKPGYPYDNAVTEVFFKYLKARCLNRHSFTSLKEVKLACFEYIESFYNNYNPHSANLELTPNLKEQQYFKKI